MRADYDGLHRLWIGGGDYEVRSDSIRLFRFRCRAAERRINECSRGSLIRASLPSDIIAFVMFCAAESYFSRLRGGELGHHYHIVGPYLLRYAQEAAWREDLRRVSNGEQAHGVVHLAMQCRPSVDFCGYWPRSRTA
jgi:hypothetical protein